MRPAGTKHDILKLLVKEELDAQALAGRLRVSPAAVRQHLDTLLALGLVARGRVASEAGRPAYLYQLTTEGRRAFPKRYDLLLGLIVDALVERHGVEAVADVVSAAARRLAAEVRGRFERVAARKRWELLLDWLEAELAWQADAREEEAGVWRVVIHQCPFQDVSREHPEVCGVFFRTLVHALYGEVPVEHAAEPGGPACCSLRIAASGGDAKGCGRRE